MIGLLRWLWRQASVTQRLSGTAVGLCCAAAVLMPFTEWAVVFIVPALALMLIGLGSIQRDWADVQEASDLQEKWRAERDRGR